jgi:hypothetical protein
MSRILRFVVSMVIAGVLLASRCGAQAACHWPAAEYERGRYCKARGSILRSVALGILGVADPGVTGGVGFVVVGLPARLFGPARIDSCVVQIPV